jgi:CsoR family transcriptional regulator, copper-sensing transcriptional repressor
MSKKESALKRLSRIEGQVRGIARMLDEDRYCIDVVTQIGAVRAALRRVEEEILRDHVAHCVEHAIASGDKSDRRRKVAELMDVMARGAITIPAREVWVTPSAAAAMQGLRFSPADRRHSFRPIPRATAARIRARATTPSR